MSNKMGLLVDLQYCTGCHSCEVACRKVQKLEEGPYGIRVYQDGPWQMADGKFSYNFVPVLTDSCDLCEDRIAQGKKPACVHHCQAFVLTYGEAGELIELAQDLKKSAIYLK